MYARAVKNCCPDVDTMLPFLPSGVCRIEGVAAQAGCFGMLSSLDNDNTASTSPKEAAVEFMGLRDVMKIKF